MFKTSHECGLALVAHTMRYDPEGEEDGMELDDLMPVRAARASFGKQDKTGENPAADKKLMHYLAEHKHLTPFEYQHATFLIECPLFIRSQIHRHRTFSYNEISRRYTDENLAFWIPDTFRGQSSDNKQASSDAVITELQHDEGSDDLWGGHDNAWSPKLHYEYSTQCALDFYQWLVASGVAREQARASLPQSLLTQFYMGGTLRNWQHFIELRRDPHAQYEVQVVANRIADQLRSLWPESCEALGV